jgi:hypothetical protein
MNKWFKLWFIPIILIGVVVGIWQTTPDRVYKTAAPIERPEGNTIEDKIVNKGIDVVLGPKNTVINSCIGAIIGWIISKFLDFGLGFIRQRIKK